MRGPEGDKNPMARTDESMERKRSFWNDDGDVDRLAMAFGYECRGFCAGFHVASIDAVGMLGN